jgi:hypothetical protein
MWKVNGWRMPSDGKSSLCLWQGELKNGLKKKSDEKWKKVKIWNFSLLGPFYVKKVKDT